MNNKKALDILNKLCNHLVKYDAVVEVMDTLVECGANLNDLREIGFDEDQIEDYIPRTSRSPSSSTNTAASRAS